MYERSGNVGAVSSVSLDHSIAAADVCRLHSFWRRGNSISEGGVEAACHGHEGSLADRPLEFTSVRF